MTEPFKVCKFQALALLRGEFRERPMHLFHHDVAFRLIGYVDGRGKYHILDGIRWFAPAQEIDGPITGDNDKPRAEGAAILDEGSGVAPELEEDLLQHILGLSGVTQHTKRYRIHRSAVAPKYLFHRALITLPDAC